MVARKSFVETHPEAALRWHPTLNEGLNPHDYTFGSNMKVWWYWEECKHSHARMIKHQTRNPNCYKCSAKINASKTGPTHSANRIQRDGSFASHFPNLTSEWSSKNILLPSEVPKFSGKEILWECSSCNHEWIAQPNQRARGKLGVRCLC